MVARTESLSTRREPLTRERVLRVAIDRADEGGAESLSMRPLAQELGVVPMALYKHVANKDELLDAMVDAVMGEVNDAVGRVTLDSTAWQPTIRARILAAREVFLSHPWAPGLMVSRTTMTPGFMRYYDDLVGLFLDSGYSIDLTHHALHALGSRALGFTQELYDDSGEADAQGEALLEQMAAAYPNLTRMVADIVHDDDTTLGWCDDQVEVEFALDLLLDGLAAQRARS